MRYIMSLQWILRMRTGPASSTLLLGKGRPLDGKIWAVPQLQEGFQGRATVLPPPGTTVVGTGDISPTEIPHAPDCMPV